MVSTRPATKIVMLKTISTPRKLPGGLFYLEEPHRLGDRSNCQNSWVFWLTVSARLRWTSRGLSRYPTSGISADLMIVAYSGFPSLIDNVEHLMLGTLLFSLAGKVHGPSSPCHQSRRRRGRRLVSRKIPRRAWKAFRLISWPSVREQSV